MLKYPMQNFEAIIYVFREVLIDNELFFEYFDLASEEEQAEGTYITPQYLLDDVQHFALQAGHF